MSKFQIVKGITDNLEDTPYVEGKVYFTYEDTESEDISIYADIDGVRRKIKEGVQREELNNYLLKTDIAAWAKESTKPTYTAAEVGALPDTTVISDEKLKTERIGDNGTYYLIFGANNTTTSSTKNIDTNLRYIKSSSSDNLEIGSRIVTTPKKGQITLSNGTTSGTTINPGATSQSVTITLPGSTGTLALIDDIPTVPENTSDLTNDSGFQTSTEVNSAIATAIGNINQFNVAIVSTLPTENIDAHTIYFMSNGGSDDSIYDEWMYINNNWEKIGTTAVDLSGYIQTSHPANGITSTDISNWNAKSDTDEKLKVTATDTSGEYYPVLSTNVTTTETKKYDEYFNFWRVNSKEAYLGIGKLNTALGQIRLYTATSGGGRYGIITPGTLSGTRTYTLPDKSGTVALTSDIPQIYSSTNTTGYLTMDTLPIYDGTVV